jgi:hypothetical protein
MSVRVKVNGVPFLVIANILLLVPLTDWNETSVVGFHNQIIPNPSDGNVIMTANRK